MTTSNQKLDDLRIFPEVRQIPENPSKSYVLYAFELHEKMRERFEVKEAESIELIKNHLKVFKNCFAASSHSSDSLILVHMLMRAYRELLLEGHKIEKPKVFLNNTLNLYKEEKPFWTQINKFLDIEDVFMEFKPPKFDDGTQMTVWSIADRVGHLPDFRRPARDDHDYKHSNTPECCDGLKKDAIKIFLDGQNKEERFDCHFVGTRAEESQMRSLGVLQRCRSYEISTRYPYPIHACTPLSFLTKNKWKSNQGTFVKKHKRIQRIKYHHKPTPEEMFDYEDLDPYVVEDFPLRYKFKNTQFDTFISKEIIMIPYDHFTPFKTEKIPENDIELYYQKWGIPKNPCYSIHNLKRMGCASCPAYKGWEKDQASDPTEDRFGMLKQNLKKMKEFILRGTEKQSRLDNSIKALKKFLKSKESASLPEANKIRLINLIKDYDSKFKTLEDYFESDKKPKKKKSD